MTGVVVILPLLFMGSLIVESFFGIPGLGSYTIDAIQSQDFAIVRSMVFLGTVLYIIGLILTDISYTLVDPRVSIREINAELNVKLPFDNAKTLNGLILEQLQSFPQHNVSLKIHPLIIEIIQVSKQGIKLVRVKKLI